MRRRRRRSVDGTPAADRTGALPADDEGGDASSAPDHGCRLAEEESLHEVLGEQAGLARECEDGLRSDDRPVALHAAQQRLMREDALGVSRMHDGVEKLMNRPSARWFRS